jgi:hypothetical protein
LFRGGFFSFFLAFILHVIIGFITSLASAFRAAGDV